MTDVPRIRRDKLQPLIAARAAALGLTAYEIAKRTRDESYDESTGVSPDAVQRYLGGRQTLNAANLSFALCASAFWALLPVIARDQLGLGAGGGIRA